MISMAADSISQCPGWRRRRVFICKMPASRPCCAPDIIVPALCTLIASTNIENWKGIRSGHGLVTAWLHAVVVENDKIEYGLEICDCARPWNEVLSIGHVPIYNERCWPNWGWREVKDPDSQRSEG